MMTLCGPKCYNAIGPKCDCWCQGVFHGKRGESMRRLALEHFGGLPKTEEQARSMLLLKPYPVRQYFPANRLLNGGTH